MKNKESIEKARINQRIGYESRNIDMRDLIHNSDPQSTLLYQKTKDLIKITLCMINNQEKMISKRKSLY